MKKLTALKALNHAGLPTLPYKILSKQHFIEEIKGFIDEYELKKFMVRTDSEDMFSPSINDTTLSDETINKIKEFFNRYTVFIMHPGNIYKNMHSLNILKNNKHIIVEVVGPGFIANDLNRYNYLHEFLELSYPSLEILKQKIMVNKKEYQSNIQNKLKDFGIERAKRGNSYLLKYKEYPPLRDDNKKYLKKCISKLDEAAKEINLHKPNWIASLSYLKLGNDELEPVFWDLYCIV